MKQFTQEFAKKFKRNYRYTNGGSQTLVFPNNQSFEFNDKKYYSGRNATKYNSTIRHDNLGTIAITSKEVNAMLKREREERKRVKAAKAEFAAREARFNEYLANGIYELVPGCGASCFLKLSPYDFGGNHSIDFNIVAKTLDISLEDAMLLSSRGKTYVFAKQLTTGRILELYHSNIDLNGWNVTVEYVSDARMAEFNHAEWASAPFAGLLGQTSNVNHFVC